MRRLSFGRSMYAYASPSCRMMAKQARGYVASIRPMLSVTPETGEVGLCIFGVVSGVSIETVQPKICWAVIGSTVCAKAIKKRKKACFMRCCVLVFQISVIRYYCEALAADVLRGCFLIFAGFIGYECVNPLQVVNRSHPQERVEGQGRRTVFADG